MEMQLADVAVPAEPCPRSQRMSAASLRCFRQPSPRSHVKAVFMSADGTRSGPASVSDLPNFKRTFCHRGSLSIFDVLNACTPAELCHSNVNVVLSWSTSKSVVAVS